MVTKVNVYLVRDAIVKTSAIMASPAFHKNVAFVTILTEIVSESFAYACARVRYAFGPFGPIGQTAI